MDNNGFELDQNDQPFTVLTKPEGEEWGILDWSHFVVKLQTPVMARPELPRFLVIQGEFTPEQCQRVIAGNYACEILKGHENSKLPFHIDRNTVVE